MKSFSQHSPPSRILYIARHGRASSGGVTSDDERFLTEEGYREVEMVAHRMEKNRAKPKVVYSSPLRRAQETAAVFSRYFESPVRVDKNLGPGTRIQSLDRILRQSQEEELLFIGHMPDVGILTFSLIGAYERTDGAARGGMRRPPGYMDFSPGSVVSVRISIRGDKREGGRLQWFLSPSLETDAEWGTYALK